MEKHLESDGRAIKFGSARVHRGAVWWVGGFVGQVLRLMHRVDDAGSVVDLTLEGAGARRSATARFGFGLTAQDRENIRWYLEDYPEYPVQRAPQIAQQVEDRLAALGQELFTAVFGTSRDAMRLWDAVAGSLASTRVEVEAGPDGASAVPWELLRDPATDGVLALRAESFVRTESGAQPPALPGEPPGALRVLLVICRPGGREDVPFRSVARHLLRLSRGAPGQFRVDLLRPPTFAQLTRVLGQARDQGEPYHAVHFDGHGTYLDAGAGAGEFALVSPPRPGPHGYLVFEDPAPGGGTWQLVDGPALGRLLADAGVPVLVLNACRSAHADLVAAPETVTAEQDAHRRVRAYGSLAQEVMDAGVAGVVAMRYNVYVVTAARFIGEVYAGLLAGRTLGAAVGAARRQLAADPVRQIGGQPRSLQDWVVPVVYEAAPLLLRTPGPDLVIDLGRAGAGPGRDTAALPPGPDAGFTGRDESLLDLDRAFDTEPVVLLHAWAGAGKSATAVEFARWYELTGAVRAVLFTSFDQRRALARLLDQVGTRFEAELRQAGVDWAALDETRRRDVALQVLAQVPVLWVWDGVEAVAGYPAGAASAWAPAEQDELASFLRDLAARTQAKLLLTSRRDERGWLGDVPRRTEMAPMPMLERLELARAVAARQPWPERSLDTADWRPLLTFTQGNPLTVATVVRQALGDGLSTDGRIEAFVARLREGSAQLTDDAGPRSGESLRAALDYGCAGAFTDAQQRLAALLALFQGCVQEVALAGIGSAAAALGIGYRAGAADMLGRAAEAGLLIARGGYYEVHPAAPWYLHGLFQEHYGEDGSDTALAVVRAWTETMARLGNLYYDNFDPGAAPEATGLLAAEEQNLWQAFRLACRRDWLDLVIGPVQGLRALYTRAQPGRPGEWRRLIGELTDIVAADPGRRRGQAWARLAEYRVDLAMQPGGDLRYAEDLQRAVVGWRRGQTTGDRPVFRGVSDYGPPSDLNLAGSVLRLGEIQLRQDEPDAAADTYREALRLFPPDAASGLATAHGALGYIYGVSGDTDQALAHYEQSIEQEERQGNRYGSGQARYQAAITLHGSGRGAEALQYAGAALEDHRAFGAGLEASQVKDLIADILQEAPGEPAAERAVNTVVARAGRTEPVPADQPLAVDSAYDLLVSIGRPAPGRLLPDRDAVWPDELLPSQGLWLRASLTVDNAPDPVVVPFFLPREGESFACDCPPDADHQAGCARRPWARFAIRTPAGPAVLRGELVIYYRVTAVHAQALILPVGSAAADGPAGPRAELLGRLSSTFRDLGPLADRTASVVVSPSRVVVNGIEFADNPFALPAAAADTAALNARQLLYDSHFRVDDRGGEHSRFGAGYTKPSGEFERDLRYLAKAGAELYVRLFTVPGADDTVSFTVPDLLRAEAQRRQRPPVLQIVDPAYDQRAILWAMVYDLPVGGDPTRYELCPSVREYGPGGRGAPPPLRCEHEEAHRGRTNVLCPFGFWGLSCILEQPPDAGRDLEAVVSTAAEPVSVLLAADSQLDRRLTEAHVSQLQAHLPPGAVARAPVATEDELAGALGPESMDVVYFYCHSGYEQQSRGAAGHYLNLGDYYIEPINVNMWARGGVWPRPHWASRHPLVVLNGCHTTEVTSGTVNSFVPAFTRWAAASGVLGTEVTLEQGLAGWVAEQTLAELAAGKTVGEAVRATRWKMFGLGNVMGFAYTPYCLANLSLRRATPT
jgi:tetratricopeptide (TPR) repeat protein